MGVLCNLLGSSLGSTIARHLLLENEISRRFNRSHTHNVQEAHSCAGERVTEVYVCCFSLD